jgi:hypothetical protein
MSLYDGLMAMLDDDSFAKLTNNEKSSDIIRFMVSALIKCGHDRTRILSSGYLGEAYVAAEKNLVINPKGQGPDAKDKDGVAMEIKVINSALGNKANLNLCVPKLKKNETVEAYYDRLRDINKAKGHVHAQHTYKIDKDGRPLMNIYVFSHEFVSFYMEYMECHTKDNVNMGGLGCNVCTKVHRLLHFEELEKQWLKDKKKFDTKLFAVQIKGSCPDPKDNDNKHA